MAASYQEAIVQVLVAKAFGALEQGKLAALAVVGGVSANSRLRVLLNERAALARIRLSIPPIEYCTDNAAMIAAAGRQLLMRGERPLIGMDVRPMGGPTSSVMEPHGRENSDSKKEATYF